eukprot:NODE_60_length_25605_cov_0.732377.p13 type:complete len:106 gc:universal NODE_60_length_25605_cov_0.732377:16893-16576(-)
MLCKWKDCIYRAQSLIELLEHSQKHESEAPFECKWSGCGRICHKRARLIAHLLTHIPVRNFQCNVCQKKYKRDQELRRHIYTIHDLKEKKNRENYMPIGIRDLIN